MIGYNELNKKEIETLESLSYKNSVILFETLSSSDAKMVSVADADELCSKFDKVNKENNYFKMKIGFRDIKRLVKAASYVS